MFNIYVATKSRGFLTNLFNVKHRNFRFIYKNNQIYEVNNNFKLILSKLIRSRIADYLGIIQRIKVKDLNFDFAFSYNRFLKTNKNYVIYLENPLALTHYSTYRYATILGKAKINKYLNDPNLKAIICMSKACFETINNFYKIPDNVILDQIYPLIPKNNFTTINNIRKKCNENNLNCLFISSKFSLKGGKEVLEVFEKLKESNINNIKLTIITKVKDLDNKIKSKIDLNRNVTLYDFNFDFNKLQKIYNNSCILLNPSRQDSFPLVILESMKAGNVILSTDLYAIPELVQHNYNGFLIGPKFRFYNYNNLPNEKVWNNRKNTIYSNYIDNKIVNFVYEKLLYLNNNRQKLFNMALNSFDKSNGKEFNEEYIINKWENIFYKLT